MLKIPRVINTSRGSYVALARTEFGGYASDTDEVIYRAVNPDFEVTVNGIPCEVRECRVSALPFNRPFRNFRFEGLYINGRKAEDFSGFETSFINTENITLQ